MELFSLLVMGRRLVKFWMCILQEIMFCMGGWLLVSGVVGMVVCQMWFLLNLLIFIWVQGLEMCIGLVVQNWLFGLFGLCIVKLQQILCRLFLNCVLKMLFVLCCIQMVDVVCFGLLFGFLQRQRWIWLVCGVKMWKLVVELLVVIFVFSGLLEQSVWNQLLKCVWV